MLPLPWRRGASPAPGGDALASVTRLQVARWRDVPRLVRVALRLRRQFRAVDGGIAVGLAAEPLRRRFWTLTWWRDEAALRAYVRSDPHAQAMRELRGALAGMASARWAVAGRPAWKDARERLETPAPPPPPPHGATGDGGR